MSAVVGLALAGVVVLASAGCDRQGGLDEARALLEAGRVDAALDALRDALSERPDDPALNLLYGRALVAGGEPSLAVWSLTKAGRDPALFSEAMLLLARAQISTHDEDGAVATLSSLLEREPDDLRALHLMVEACIEARQLDRALETVERALDLAPDDLGLEMSRMRVFLHLDRKDEAEEVLAGIRRRIPELADLDDEQSDYLAGRYCAIEAMFRFESGDPDHARTSFEQCLTDHPDHPQVLSSAIEFFDALGERDRATTIARDVLDRDPGNLGRRVALATRLTRLGHADEAETLLRSVVEAQPGVWTALVDHYVDVEEQAKALDALDHAIAEAQGPIPGDWKTMRADLLIQTGRLDEAERAIDEIEEEVYATTARGRLELARGHPARALELFERGLRLWPDGTAARYLAAEAAEQLGDFERAEAEYREAYRSDQTYTDAGLQLADLLASRGLPGEAATLANAYLQNNPDDADGFERAIGWALEAKDGDLARTFLVHYQRQPGSSVRAAAFAVRHLLQTHQTAQAAKLADDLRLDPALPAHFPLLEARCEAWVASGRAAEALALVRRARQAEPQRLDLAGLEAELLAATGATREARAAWEQALARDPGWAPALRALAAVAERDGDAARARDLYDRAAAADANDADSLVRAAGLLPAGPEGETRLREALRRQPRNGSAAAALAARLVDRGPASRAEVDALLARARRFGAAERADALAERVGASPPRPSESGR
ncbi:MAG: tetratricopeptide repeat protein [Myxococcota bacterium]